MAGISYTFNGQLFEIKGIGLTAEQLKAIGDQQAATGSLIGLRPGDVLSAATQAQAGLQSAQAQVGQALSGVTGALELAFLVPPVSWAACQKVLPV